jgi:hypothetical protein
MSLSLRNDLVPVVWPWEHIAAAVSAAIVAALPVNDGSYSVEIYRLVNGSSTPEVEYALQRFANGAPRPTWGPLQPEAASLGNGGYRAPRHWRSISAEAEDH